MAALPMLCKVSTYWCGEYLFTWESRHQRHERLPYNHAPGWSRRSANSRRAAAGRARLARPEHGVKPCRAPGEVRPLAGDGEHRRLARGHPRGEAGCGPGELAGKPGGE